MQPQGMSTPPGFRLLVSFLFSDQPSHTILQIYCEYFRQVQQECEALIRL